MKEENSTSKEVSLLSKASQIWEGWTEKPKTDQPWFQERLRKCAPCEYSSANKELNLLQRTKEKAFGEHYCMACGCPFSKKLSVKRAACGKVELGLEPEWLPLAIEGDSIARGTILENPGTEPYTISNNNGFYNLDFGNIDEESIDVDFELFVPIQYKLITTVTPCVCTHVSIKELGRGKYRIIGKISTLTFRPKEKTVRVIEVRFDKGYSVFVNVTLVKQ